MQVGETEVFLGFNPRMMNSFIEGKKYDVTFTFNRWACLTNEIIMFKCGSVTTIFTVAVVDSSKCSFRI